VLKEEQSSEALVPRKVAIELLNMQRGIVRREQRDQFRHERESFVRGLVQRHNSGLSEKKHTAWVAGSASAGIAIVAALLRAVAISGVGPTESGIFITLIAAFGVFAVCFGLVGWFYRVRAERLERLIEEIEGDLAFKGQLMRVFDEIEERGGQTAPWTFEELHEAVDRWASSASLRDPRTIAFSASQIGVNDFTRLLILKGLELGALEESASTRSETEVVYARVRMSTI
jgi:hypothetical protein